MIEHFEHQFVEFMPPEVEEGKLYISIEYATAVHKCASGCGQKVVTPLTPTDWSLTFDGDTVSLSPSIGNWNFDCQSHYWIKHNEVVWSARWTRDQILEGRRRDAAAKQRYYRNGLGTQETTTKQSKQPGLIKRLRLKVYGFFGRHQR